MPRRVLNETQKYVKNAMLSQMQGTVETRNDMLMMYNSSISNAAPEDETAATVEEFMKEYVFPVDQNGNLDYDKTYSFFENLGRYSVTKQNEYLHSVSEDPNKLKGDGLAAYKRPSEFLAKVKAWASEDDVVTKFNEQVDEYNSRLKKNEFYKKREKITPETLQNWFDHGKDYDLGRAKGDKKKNLENAAKIEDEAFKSLGIDEQALIAEQQKSAKGFEDQSKKNVSEFFDRYVKEYSQKQANQEEPKKEEGPKNQEEPKKEEEPKVLEDQNKAGIENENIINVDDADDNIIKIDDIANQNNQIINNEPEIKNININQEQKQVGKHSPTEDALNDLKKVAQEIKDNPLPTDGRTKYMQGKINAIQEIEENLRDSKKSVLKHDKYTHVDSKEWFEPMMDAAAEVRGLGTKNNKVKLEDAVQKFDTLIEKCDAYIGKRSWGKLFNWMFKSPEGNARLEYARELKHQAEQMKRNYIAWAKLDRANEAINKFGEADLGRLTHKKILGLMESNSSYVTAARNATTDGYIPEATENAHIKIMDAEEIFRDHTIRRTYNAMKGQDGLYTGDINNDIRSAVDSEIDKNDNKSVILDNVIKLEKGVVKTNANNIMNKISGENGNIKKESKKKHTDVVKNNKIINEDDKKIENPQMNNIKK